MILHRDYETRSACDLRKCGAHRYAEDPTTDVIVAVFILEYPDGNLGEPVIWRPGMDVPDIVVTAASFPEEYTVAGHNWPLSKRSTGACSARATASRSSRTT